jgi:hypothetical protein
MRRGQELHDRMALTLCEIETGRSAPLKDDEYEALACEAVPLIDLLREKPHRKLEELSNSLTDLLSCLKRIQ